MDITSLLIALIGFNLFIRLIQYISDEECKDKFLVYIVVNVIQLIGIIFILLYLNDMNMNLYAFSLLFSTIIFSFMQMIFDERITSIKLKRSSSFLLTFFSLSIVYVIFTYTVL